MRITDSILNSTSLRNYRTSTEKLYNINQQIASGMKIQNSYEDASTYIDTMRLNYEVDTLTQASSSATKAQSFANNTDSTLNDFTDVLDQFKTKLTQAANASNSTTSLDAIAKELEALKTQLVNLSNTSINGQYLFSGSALSTKPISSDGTYNGNGDSLSAVVGSGVEMTYNIDGESLFLGTDSEYSKVVSTNVKMLNQTKLHPDVMDTASSSDSSSEVYLSESDTIRDMVGDTDSDSTNDPNSVFYLSGRKSTGETFATKITLSSSSSVSDLLESIGQAYGNTSTNKLVDVTMNKNGQIEVTDLTTGHQTLDMNLFAATDRSATAGTSGNADQTDVNALLSSSNVDILTFDASNYTTNNTASTISSRADTYTSGLYDIGYPLQTSDGNTATASTLMSDIMPSNVANIDINGTSTSISGMTVQDFMTDIENAYGLTSGSLRVENGQIIAENPGVTAAVMSTIQLTAQDASSTTVAGFSLPDGVNYSERGFEKDGNELTGNVSQVVKSTNEYATTSTKLSEVAGTSTLDGKSFTLNYTDIYGNSNSATLDLSNAGSTFTVNGNTYTIYDGSGNATSADNVTYKQLSDVIGMLTSNSLPTSGVPTATSTPYEQYNYAIKTSTSSVEVGLDDTGQLTIKDRTASKSNIDFMMYDNDTSTYDGTASTSLSFMANNAVTIENPSIDLFSQLDDIIAAVKSGNYRMDSTSSNPRNIGMQNGLSVLDHLYDHVTKEHTKIGAYSNALSDEKDRVDTLNVNVKTVQSSIIDVDVSEAYLEYNQISTSYQAMLSTIAKVNQMSLLNYM